MGGGGKGKGMDGGMTVQCTLWRSRYESVVLLNMIHSNLMSCSDEKDQRGRSKNTLPSKNLRS